MPIKELFVYLINCDKYKIIYLLLVIAALYGHFVLGLNVFDGWNSILITFQFSYFNVLFFITTFITTIHVIETFNNKFKDIVLRLKNKRKYIFFLIFTIFVMFIFNVVLFGILYFLLVFISKASTTKNDILSGYNINIWIYTVYYTVRYFLLLLLINIIAAFIYLNFGFIKMYIFELFVLILLIMEKLVGFNDSLYVTFSKDIFISFLVFTIAIGIVVFLSFYLLKKRKLDIG